MQNIAIRLRNISKAYKLYPNKQARLKEALNPFGKKYHRNFMALQNIDLDIPKGTILGILGKNGAGKSTLLQVISSILTPTSGTVQVNGRIVALHHLGAGFHQEYTGLQNIYFYGAVMGLSREEMRKKEEAIIDFAELGEFIHQPLKTYSSGMKARLAFAVATEIDPDILILDEVLSVGDELFRRKCFARMEQFFKGGKTVLFVSHTLSSVSQICSHAILLDRGEIILDGSTKLVTTYYQNYLFTKKENIEQFRNEIIELNANKGLKESLSQKSVAYENAFSLNNAANDKKETVNKEMAVTSKSATEDTLGDSNPFEAYIPNFKPKTTRIVKNSDVSISDVEICSLNGQKVNVLVMNEEYIIKYKFSFDSCEKEVFFAYSITNEKGLFIVNCNTRSYPLDIVTKGDRYLIEWHFSCLLMPGIYYLTIGSGSQATNEAFYQITDALAFKVVSPFKLTYGGLVSLYKKPTITRLAK